MDPAITPQVAIDRIEAVTHPRAGDRRLHTRGAVYDATFTPSPKLAERTVAPHLLGESKAVVRFSNGSPDPNADDRVPGVRGIAVKLLDASGEHGVADLLGINSPAFPVRNPEAFVDLVEAMAMVAGNPIQKLKAGAKIIGLLITHPESRPAILGAAKQPIPASYATVRYNGIHAFLLVHPDGSRQAFRFGWVPQQEEALDPKDARGLARDFMIAELDERLAGGPVTFALTFQLAGPGDPLDDPSQAWPAERPTVQAGTLSITRRSTDEDRWQKAVFDPSRTGEGVEMSGDPVLCFRPGAYSVSAERRLSGH